MTQPTRSTDTPEVKPAFTPFSWLPPGVQHTDEAEFAALAMDVSRGVNIALKIANQSNVALEDSDPNHPPTVSRIDMSYLTLMAIGATQLLADRAEHLINALSRKNGAA